MKYFLDTEFHEYHKQLKVAGIKVGKPIPTIDLISIGIVSEDFQALEMYRITDKNGNQSQSEPTDITDCKKYYAICKDFNLKDAWYSNQGTKEEPNYWLRENVLMPIHLDLIELDSKFKGVDIETGGKLYFKEVEDDFEYNKSVYYKELKHLINKYGKTKKEIAEEIKDFVYKTTPGWKLSETGEKVDTFMPTSSPIDFYAYYADYDWVVFCQLFGKMMDLPTGFPIYCKDLKQVMDELIYSIKERDETFEQGLEWIKSQEKYPKQENEHNALCDAKWNKRLFEFLNKL